MTEEQEVHNDALSHVILLEAALIEFRGQYLRKNAAGMTAALERFQERCGEFADCIERLSKQPLPADAVDPVGGLPIPLSTREN